MKAQSPLISTIYKNLYSPMDIAGLAILRIFFGLLIATEAWRYTDLLRIVAKFTEQNFHFKFMFFEWVEPLSNSGLMWVFIAYGISGLLITLGLFYHIAILVATACISYMFLIDATNYLNHFYLIIVFSAMMFFIPAHKGWSIYALIHKNKAKDTVPGWAIWLIRIQLFIVYFYAAIAKMNVDWINGMPLQDWIGGQASQTGIESYLALPAVIYFFTYTGLLYDLAVAPMLLFKKTRAIAYCLSICFHLTNYYLFNIGVFPWFMMATTTIFFDTSWPRNVLVFFWPARFLNISYEQTSSKLKLLQKIGLGAMIAHLSLQAVLPLRHFFYPGYVSWTEEGHDFAWHMKLRGKTGTISFTLKDPTTGHSQVVNPGYYLTKRQVSKMATMPDLILQFAHFLRDRFTAPGEKPVEIYAETKIRLNNRKAQRLIDPTVNLSEVNATLFGHDTWIMPLRQPVWNAENKKNRFGPALINDAIAKRAIHNYDKKPESLVANP